MGEILIGAGDSVSRLLQTHAREAGLKRVWIGNGRIDSRNLVFELRNVTNQRDNLWRGLQELYSMSELKELPENVQAKLMAVILNSRACTELEVKEPVHEVQTP